MFSKYTKSFIIILLLSDLSFSEWILDFSDEFGENSSDFKLWSKQNGQLGTIKFLQENVNVINGSLRLSADRRTFDNESVLTGSQIFNTYEMWNEGFFEIRVKISNSNEFRSLVWLGRNESLGDQYPRIQLFHSLNSDPLIINSGLLLGSKKFFGFSSSTPNNIIEDDFNIFSMEWRSSYICWRLNGQPYWNESIDKNSRLERESISSNKTKQLFTDKFKINIEHYPSNDIYQSFEKNSEITSYLYIDYIRVYYWNDLNTVEKSFEGIVVQLVVVLGSIALFMIVLIAVVIIYMRRKLERKLNNNSYQNAIKGSKCADEFDLYHNDLNVYYSSNYDATEYDEYDMPEEYEEVAQNMDYSEISTQNNGFESENNYTVMKPTITEC